MKTQFLSNNALIVPTISPVVGGDIAQATKEARVASAFARKIFLNDVEGFGQVVSVQKTIGGDTFAHYTLANYLATVTAARFTTQTIGLEGSVIAGTVDANIAGLRVILNGGDAVASNSKVKHNVVMQSKELSSVEMFESELKGASAELLETLQAQLNAQVQNLLETGLHADKPDGFYTLSVEGNKVLDLTRALSKLDREKHQAMIQSVTDRLACDFFKLDGDKLIFIFDDSVQDSNDVIAEIGGKFETFDNFAVVQGDSLAIYKDLEKQETAARKAKDRKLQSEVLEQLEQLETCLVLVVG